MAKKLAVLLTLVVFVAAEFEFNQEWEDWKTEHSKQYRSTEEELSRHIIWESNKKYVDNHNEYAEEFGFTIEMNEFADMDSAEFAAMYNGFQSKQEVSASKLFEGNITIDSLPDTVDWREKGYVTKVKNQGQCGSCWAFSTTGSLEGQHFKATGKLVSLSEQNLVDCSKEEGNHGCQGGLMVDGFEYIIKNGGIDTEESYPYMAHKEKCRFKKSDVGATCSSYKKIKKESENDLQSAVATIGPISVGIDASHRSFQLYKQGVYYESKCSEKKLDHGVLVVGYGSERNKDYWLVKNSWGKRWGMDGYLMMSRNRDNNCGIATSASYPIV